jgi:hypothetical protein
MRRFGSGLFWIAIAFVAGLANYTVKQMVQGLDDELNNVRKKTVAEQRQIHDLTAEWTYLNQPELLADLNRRYLGLVAMAPKQERGTIADIPMRPAAPPQDIPPQPQTVAAIVPEPAAPAIKQAPAIVPASAAVPAIAPQPAAERPKPASIDALFAQVAGDR